MHADTMGRIVDLNEQVRGTLPLVNKDCDFLKDEHSVPPRWRQDLNKNMVRTEDGRWVLADRPLAQDPHEDIDHHLGELGLASSHTHTHN